MDDADNFVMVVDDGEVSKTGFVELVEGEGAEDFFVIDEDQLVFRHHEVFDLAVIEIHDGGDAAAVFAA